MPSCRPAFLVLLLTTLPAGCSRNERTPFPAKVVVLQPLPARAGAGESEALELEAGKDRESDFVRARATVHASLEQTWAALRDPDVLVDRRRLRRYTVEQEREAGYAVAFRTRIMPRAIVSVELDLTWRQRVVPGGVEVRYAKTWGTSFVKEMEGTITLREVAPGVTEVTYAQRMSATRADSSDIAAWTRDLHASMLARVHGRPLPAYRS